MRTVNSHKANINKEIYNDHLQKCLQELEKVIDEFSYDTVNCYTVKEQAAEYIDLDLDEELDQADLKELRIKAKKIRKSDKKANRYQASRLAKHISTIFNARIRDVNNM